MDKYEYKLRAEEISSLIEQRKFGDAVKIADTIDWRRVKSVSMLCKVSELYKMNRRYEDSKDVLLLADARFPDNRKIIYSLCELSIKLEDVVNALEYYKKFVQISPKDPIRYILQYRLYEAQDVSLDERIQVLEEYKKRDYREKWGYELAYLYHRLGLRTKCIEECDELILWFGEGKYVIKAMELKMLHAPLSSSQQEKYDAYTGGSVISAPAPELAEEKAPQETVDFTEPSYKEKDPVVSASDEEMPQTEPIYSSVSMDTIPSMPIQIKAVEVSHAPTTRIPSKKVDRQAEELELAAKAASLINEEPVEETVANEEVEEAVETTSAPSVTTEIYFSEDEQDEVTSDEMASEESAVESIEENETQEEELPEGAVIPVDSESVTIDLPTIPLAAPEEVDIEVQAPGVGKFDTINLQNELARNLAEFMQKEDMEAIDATRALPIDSIQTLAELENPDETILAAMAQAGIDPLRKPNKHEDAELEETKDLANPPLNTEITKSVVAEINRVLGDENQDMITEEDLLKAIEEEKAIEEAATVEIPVTNVKETVEEVAEEEVNAPVAEEPVTEEAVVEEAAEEPVIALTTSNTIPLDANAIVMETVVPQLVEEVTEEPVAVAPIVEEDTAPAIEEAVEEPVTEETVVEETTEEPVSVAPIVEEVITPVVEEAVEEPVTEEIAVEEAITPVPPVVPVAPVIPAVPIKPVAVAKPTVGLPIQKAAEIFNKPVEELTEAEKQITGQLSFVDILAEWEQVKKTEDEKLIEEMRQRVIAQTGPISKTEIEETLENAEQKEETIEPNTFDSQVLPEVNPVIEPSAVEDVITEDDEVEELVEIEDVTITAPISMTPVEEAPAPVVPEVKPETHQFEFDTAEINGLEEKLSTSTSLEEPEPVEPINLEADILSEIDAKSSNKEEAEREQPSILNEKPADVSETPVSAPIAVEQEKAAEITNVAEREASSEPRLLDKDEKALFGSYARTKQVQEEIANVIDHMTMNPSTGNVIITAENGVDINTFVTNLINVWAKNHPGQVKKSAKISPETLNEKDVKESLKKIPNGILVVQKAGLLNDFALVPLGDYLNETKEPGVIFILIDSKSEIDKIWAYDSMPKECFNLRIDITSLDNDSLVNYGKEYALEQEYSIDEMGVLALYTRISERQTNEHAVTIEEVKEIVDEAIERAEKKSMSHFMDVIFSKRYDDEDMIVLREKDFIV